MADRTLLEEIQRVKALKVQRDDLIVDALWHEANALYNDGLQNLMLDHCAEIEAAVRDAEKYKEYEQVRAAATMQDALHMDLTINEKGQVFGISAVISTLELGSTLLGIKAIGLCAEDQATKLFTSIDAAREKGRM